MMEILKPKETMSFVSGYFTKNALPIYNPRLKMMHIFILTGRISFYNVLTNISAARLIQYNPT